MSARYVTRSNITLNLGTVNCSSFQKETATCVHTHGKHIESFLYCENAVLAKYGIVVRDWKDLRLTLPNAQVVFVGQDYKIIRINISNVQQNNKRFVLNFRNNTDLSRSSYSVNYMGIISRYLGYVLWNYSELIPTEIVQLFPRFLLCFLEKT